MTRFLFIRHAAIDGLGKQLAGRTPAVTLNAAGREQVARLAHRLGSEPLHMIYTSPQQRALETAQPIADRLGLELEITAELDEIDFGEWTGKTYDQLARSPEWRSYNALRSCRRIPNGELLLEAQTRVVRLLTRLNQNDGCRKIALVSHGDVIRSALAHYLGIPLDLFSRFEISPASSSTIELGDNEPRILWVNKTEA